MLADFSTMDRVRFAVAVLAAAGGVLSSALFAARIRSRDVSLLYFGLGAGLYGVRLLLEATGHFGGLANLVITLFLPIVLVLFVAEMVAAEWKKAVWWLIAAYLAVASLGVLSLLAHRSLGLVSKANSVVVLLSIPIFILSTFFAQRRADRDLQILRAGLTIFLLFAVYTNLVSLGLMAGNPRLEFIGFAVLLGCFGYAALARAQRNEERLLALNKELEIARSIQSQLLPQVSTVPGLVTAIRYMPASSVAGDFYDFLVRDGALGILIADVSGHGVPAALSASMVKVAVRSQLERAGEPAAVLLGMNSILCGNLQGQFVSAGYLFLNPAQGVLHYAGAGHPPVLIWRSRQREVESLEENGLLLGILPNASYTQKTARLDRGDRCVLYTDGLLEATCPSGEEFGEGRLRNVLAESASLPLNAFCDALMQKLVEWCGAASRQQDDVTIVAIDFA